MPASSSSRPGAPPARRRQVRFQLHIRSAGCAGQRKAAARSYSTPPAAGTSHCSCSKRREAAAPGTDGPAGAARLRRWLCCGAAGAGGAVRRALHRHRQPTRRRRHPAQRGLRGAAWPRRHGGRRRHSGRLQRTGPATSTGAAAAGGNRPGRPAAAVARADNPPAGAYRAEHAQQPLCAAPAATAALAAGTAGRTAEIVRLGGTWQLLCAKAARAS